MRFCAFLIILFFAFTTAIPAFAQGKRQEKQRVKKQDAVVQTPELFKIIGAVAKGAHLESVDAKNVIFILRPTGAFIQIKF